MSAEDVERCEAHLREREDDLIAAMVDAVDAARDRIACSRDHRAKYTAGLTPDDSPHTYAATAMVEVRP